LESEVHLQAGYGNPAEQVLVYRTIGVVHAQHVDEERKPQHEGGQRGPAPEQVSPPVAAAACQEQDGSAEER
jgi:hypothetical protein